MDIRLVKNDELQQAVQLADDVFRKPGQSSMGTSFPFLFAPGLSHSYGAFVDGRLVSFMGLVPFVIHVGDARLNVFSMGAVCTHPDYRGQGIAGQMLDRCKQHAEEAGASLLFISGDRSLYTRVHCYPFGLTEHFTLDAEGAVRLKAAASALQAGDSPLQLRPFQAADAFALHAAAATREVAYEQSVTDLGRMIDAEAYASCMKLEHQTLVAAHGTGSVDSFAVIAAPGRSADSKPPTAIEFAGPAAHVGSLLAEAVERLNLTQLKIPVSWHEQQLLGLLQEAAVPYETKANNGTVYVVNPQRVLEQAFPVADKDLKQAFAITSLEEGSYKVKAGDTSIEVNPAELVSLLFDPLSPLKPLLPGWSTIPLPHTSGLNYI
ncbi:GNAT family N-acetyltransferase [Paenibacillus sp. WQ 127069]|uniref:GNAT family N-acetyltransferase n=1 Tax=Paenibacillus baimaensis TaxID=2982185 RepID=A0ABT2USP7_9BACL|nr:GNAT family N-acetyltransferase [Paenibacillus sp. WQ 127069]MCU6797689.1 GNAT family N-acetyltransferase [Paenibacillus sp. WQ 127069]